MDERYRELEDWLRDQLGVADFSVRAASSDASFRRYFRVEYADNSVIAMDAPPAQEDCGPFVKVAKAFSLAGVNVPRILAQNLEQGFLLLTDFGDTSYLSVLNEQTVDLLYGDAFDALLCVQQGDTQSNVRFPRYDRQLLQRELGLFEEWFVGRYLGLALQDIQQKMLAESFDLLVANALEQPVTWVHRDYHSRNLMVTPFNNPGVIDFQDAVEGPVTYDLVSLLRDCYIAWPRARVEQWVTDYYARVSEIRDLGGAKVDQFIRWFDLMGVQRHLKAIGIFARLNLRDGKPGYLKDIPRTMSYVMDVAGRYDELAPFHAFIADQVVSPMKAKIG